MLASGGRPFPGGRVSAGGIAARFWWWCFLHRDHARRRSARVDPVGAPEV